MIPFPDKKYNIIYADPPWEQKRGPSWNSGHASLPLPYPTLTVGEIVALPVHTISADDAHLYLWVTNKYLPQAFTVVEAWGFHFSCALTWCKVPHGIGLGGTYVQTTEHLLFARRGKLSAQRRIDTTWFEQKRGKHSEKPAFFRDLIVMVSGDLPRIELFARQRVPGWDGWGDQLGA